MSFRPDKDKYVEGQKEVLSYAFKSLTCGLAAPLVGGLGFEVASVVGGFGTIASLFAGAATNSTLPALVGIGGSLIVSAAAFGAGIYYGIKLFCKAPNKWIAGAAALGVMFVLPAACSASAATAEPLRAPAPVVQRVNVQALRGGAPWAPLPAQKTAVRPQALSAPSQALCLVV